MNKRLLLSGFLVAMAAVSLWLAIPRAPQEPTEVVLSYARYTLGRLPDSDYDEEKAKTFLHPDLRPAFTDSRFIPFSYGIQDGPERVEAELLNLSPGQSNVKMTGYYGADTVAWRFTLLRANDAWKIVSYSRMQE